jgi:hypothetical protein
MAANVLNSWHAVRMSVFVVRAFIRLHHTVELQKDIMAKLEELERRQYSHHGVQRQKRERYNAGFADQAWEIKFA